MASEQSAQGRTDADATANLWRKFRDVDASEDPESLGGYLDDISSVPSVEETKRHSLELLGLTGGEAVLDVGCGMGHEVSAIARIVGPNGRVTGLDTSARLIAHARAICEREHGPVVKFVVGDAQDLPFADDSFDACRADRTLQHVPQPDLALREMVRVVRPGGLVVVSEGGWTLRAPTLDQALTNSILSSVLTTEDDHHWVGFLLPVLFRMAGLADVRAVSERHEVRELREVERILNLELTLARSVVAGAVGDAEARAWMERLSSAVGRGDAWVDLDMVHLAGTKR